MRITTTRLTAAAGLAALTLAAPASAHMSANPGEAPADGFAKLDFQVPHGCEGSPTKVVRVQVPRSVPSVTPQVHPGWEVTTKEGPKDPVDLHGEEVTEGVSEVIWTATSAPPLPDDRLDVFGLSLKLPAREEGETVYFPSIQECERGSERWIQVPAEGESEDDLDAGAPSVVLTAAEDGHGGGDEAGHGDEAGAEGDDVAVEQASATGPAAAAAGDDDGPSTGLVIAALVLGGLGLATGGAGLVSARRRTA